jgi:hypothetical protein
MYGFNEPGATAIVRQDAIDEIGSSIPTNGGCVLFSSE